MPRALWSRPADAVLILFFVINLGFITYVVHLEQLVIADPTHFTYPLWPPPALVDVIHRYGHAADPLLLARPPFWQATIWMDNLLFGPYYVAAIIAFVRGAAWIRVPSLVYAGLLLSNVNCILFEELLGAHRTPNPPLVLTLNAPWILVPLYLTWRMARPAPFASRSAAA
ncbi:EXPERA domain-containing protein [Deinococcus rufus]|uniref:EXPERA domain-containing protein n=1 Tax=Deinococcus rufus TaxID=2136097 RepID=A0ABV7Z9K3_9DEIO